jgi:valyl-tRNA synthetase
MTDVSSIMIAQYPSEVPGWFSPEAEAQMEIVKEAIHGARSLRADYRVANHIKADFYFKSESAEIQATLAAQVSHQSHCMSNNQFFAHVLCMRYYHWCRGCNLVGVSTSNFPPYYMYPISLPF